MNTAYEDWDEGNTFTPPATLEDAIEELKSLRRRLLQANEKRAKAAEKAELTKRSLVAEIRLLRLRIEKLEGE